MYCLVSTGPLVLLADWFAQKNIDDTIIFIQYVFLFRFRFGQLLMRLFYSKCVLRVRQADQRALQAWSFIYKGWSYNSTTA